MDTASPVTASPATARMPAAFVGHGSPTNALEDNRYTRAWAALGRAIPRPRAVLCVSAHWYIGATAVTGMARPRTIHDFYGFERALYEVQYPAPGLPELAEEIAEAVQPTWIGTDPDSWGLDHGTWSVLRHMFPDASVPVVQLSINVHRDADYHLELGAKLDRLRRRGVFVIGSGNVVHNLGAVDFSQPDAAYPWAQRFDDRAEAQVREAPAELARLASDPDYRNAVPTPDHFIPLLYLGGMASAAREIPAVLTKGYAYGSLSMTAYTLGAPTVAATGDGESGPPPDAPPSETNI